MSSEKEHTNTEKDNDIDDLLSSALQDFEIKSKVPVANDSVKNEPSGEDGAVWNEEFMSQAKFFEDRMASLFGSAGVNDVPTSEQFNLGFQKMAEAATLAIDGNGLESVEPQFVDSITQALKGLKDGSENLSAVIPPEDVANMFSGLQMSEDGEDSNPFLPFVQGMMQSLLSAEVLLPSLKELLEKYPSWLAENGEKIDIADKNRYIKQQELFEVICSELEQEKSDDSTEVKNNRFKLVLENMQKLHEYGQPPNELIGEGGPNMPALPSMNDPSQCSVM